MLSQVLRVAMNVHPLTLMQHSLSANKTIICAKKNSQIIYKVCLSIKRIIKRVSEVISDHL